MNKKVKLPNFIIIGPPKSGTTSLYNYLKQHPDIYLPETKELHYFTYEFLKENANGPGDRDVLPRLCSTYQEYENNYLHVNDEKAIGEISPSYFYYAHVSERIIRELGSVKILMILRNPVQKAFSQYVHMVSEKRETLTFYEALMEERKRAALHWLDIWRYAESTLYADRIKKYIEVFGRDNVKVLLFEEMVNSPDTFMSDLYTYLGVDGSFICDTSRAFNKTRVPRFKFVSDLFKRPNVLKDSLKKFMPEGLRTSLRESVIEMNAIEKPVMDNESRKYLRDFFAEDMKKLQEVLERDLDWLDGE